MQEGSITSARNGDGPLLSIPAELKEKMFCLLPLFSDVFALAGTCHRLRRVWTTNTTSVYRHIAPESIACERDARRLLADQGGPAFDFPTLSAAEVRQIVWNSRIVDKAILQFERETAYKVRCRSCDQPCDKLKATDPL